MATTAPNSNATLVCGVERSLGGRSWRWRGGPNQYDGPAAGLGDDILTQLLLARGVARDDLERQREPKLAAFLPDPAIFQDMEAAAERLAQAILTREKVTIYGDYDVDGATSAALLIRLFGMLGHEADYYIPDRLLEGYGPSGEALVKLGEQGSSLVVTVDCGAMAHEALAAARDAGVEVIVIDHHKCSPERPPALALVNPNRLDENDLAAGHGHLAAVGVAFLLAIALVRTLRERGYFESRREPDLMGLLDLVALGNTAALAQRRPIGFGLVDRRQAFAAAKAPHLDNGILSRLVRFAVVRHRPTSACTRHALRALRDPEVGPGPVCTAQAQTKGATNSVKIREFP